MEKLPEKWQVEITPENKEVLREYWLNLQPPPNKEYTEEAEDFKYWLLSSPYEDGTYQFWGGSEKGEDSYTIITFEDFKKLVLKEHDLVGTKFQCDGLSTIYTIEKVENNLAYIDWASKESMTCYDLNKVSSYFKNKIWTKVEEKSLQLENKQKTMKYTLEDLKTKDLIVFLTKENHNILQEALGRSILRNDVWEGNHMYSIKQCTYSSSSNETSKGAYTNNEIVVDFNDIELGREIIEYELKDVKFIKAISAIISKNLAREYTGENLCVLGNNMSIHYLKEANVLDLWFKSVYKLLVPKYKELELGIPKRKFLIYKNIINVIDGSGSQQTFNESDFELL